MTVSPQRLLALFASLATLAGCAERRQPGNPAPQSTTVVATRPTGPAQLAMDEIEPRPVLGRATTKSLAEPTSRPAIDAIVLYAEARGALLENRRQAAIALLERAVALDPDSYDLNYTLGRAYRGSAMHDDRSIAAMRRAAAIEPDHLDVQLDLGRQYLAKGDVDQGLERLRLAIQTSDYAADDPRAAEANLFLAHALNGAGYERAALGQYERLLARLAEGNLRRGANADLAYQITNKLYVQVGELYLRQDRPAEALAAFERAAAGATGGASTAPAASTPADEMDLQARITRTLLVLGRRDEAVTRAARLVARSRASAESLALLRDVYRAIGRESGLTTELARLHADKPQDRAILFALTDLLRADGRAGEADALLDRASDAAPADAELVRRRFASREAAGDLRGAATLLVLATARQPELAAELGEPWRRLLRPANHARFGLDDLAALDAGRSARVDAALGYAQWTAAKSWPRRSEARTFRTRALASAVQFGFVFPPTLRARLHEIWSDPNRGDVWKREATEALVASIVGESGAGLAAELRGRAMLYQEDVAGAASALTEAAKRSGLAGPGPELRLAIAIVARAAGDGPAYERLMWKLVGDHPAFNAAYHDLHDYYWAKSQTPQADRVTAVWADAEPLGLDARLVQAQDQLRLGRFEPAEVILRGLMVDFGDDAGVLAAMQSLHSRTGRNERFIQMLEERLSTHPASFTVAGRLAQLYLSLSRVGDASRVLDRAREAAKQSDEPDVLYALAGLYTRAGQREASDAVLLDVLAIDAAHPSAANDLAYSWAEQGRNLERAEALTRGAVAEEPDSPTLLDTLGWVLYKRGRFAESRDTLERAIGRPPADEASPDEADPVVLDHAGDAAYRHNDREAAGRYWERSRKRMVSMGLLPKAAPATGPATAPATGPSTVPSEAPLVSPRDDLLQLRDDLRSLRLNLARKQRQLTAGQPVDVAPVIETVQADPKSQKPEARNQKEQPGGS